MTTVFTPYDLSEAVKTGKRVWRKQILPIGQINYEGQTLDFDKAFLTDLANAFSEGAYDQVPFVFADPANAHNEDPDRFRGELTSVDLADDGLYGVFKVTKEGEKVLKDNPRLGVSARIRQGLEKADGRKFPRAIRHVLATMDPKVTGMRPWQAVDLSNAEDEDDDKVVDLTAQTYGGTDVAKSATKDKPNKDETTITVGDKIIDLSTMSDDDFTKFLDFTSGIMDAEVVAEDEVDEDEDKGPKEGDEAVVEFNGEKITVVFSEGTWVTKPPKPEVKPDPDTDLAEHVVDSETRDTVKQMQIDLANERYATRRKELLREGVPAFLIDLAEPLLNTPGPAVIDLAGSDKGVNATQIVGDMLDGLKGMIDIHPESGHQIDLSDVADDKKDDDPDAALLAAWDEYGS